MLSNFKRAQFQMINEVQTIDRFAFSRTSRDLLLQTFSYWSKWLVDLEDHFIGLESDRVDESTITFTNLNLYDTTMELVSFADQNDSGMYDPHVIEMWEKVFPKEVSMFIKSFGQKVCGLTISEAYSVAVNMATLFLNHHLFVLQEIDSLISDKVVDFIALDRFDLNLFIDHLDNLPKTRLEVYQTFKPELSSMSLYRYVEDCELESSPILQHAYSEVVCGVRGLVTLTCVK